MTVTTSKQSTLHDIVDTGRYPLTDPGGDQWTGVVSAAREDLRTYGCSVLPDFVRGDRLEELREECASAASHAYYRQETVNVYNTAPDPSLPGWHPARLTTQRGNAFVGREDIPPHFMVQGLYTDHLFQRFVAECLELPTVHPLADPLAGLCINVLLPGREHPWHFDTNEFTVSVVTQSPDEGGRFEYCPNIRSRTEENFDDVMGVLSGDERGLARRLTLQPGDLQLFRGRFSLHRVTAVKGEKERHSAIFAYSHRPGVVGNPARTKQLFGRLTAAHTAGGAPLQDGLLA